MRINRDEKLRYEIKAYECKAVRRTNQEGGGKVTENLDVMEMEKMTNREMINQTNDEREEMTNVKCYSINVSDGL